MLRIPQRLGNWSTDGGKVASPTHRLSSTPHKHYVSASGTHFCSWLREPQFLLWLEGLGKLRKLIHLIRSQTGDLPACSTVMAILNVLRKGFKCFNIVFDFRHIIRKVEVVPSKRIQQVLEGELSRGHDSRGLGPCGGFSTQYACMCDYHSMPYREEVSWVRLCDCT
jgi:hypothetical protein